MWQCCNCCHLTCFVIIYYYYYFLVTPRCTLPTNQFVNSVNTWLRLYYKSVFFSQLLRLEISTGLHKPRLELISLITIVLWLEAPQSGYHLYLSICDFTLCAFLYFNLTFASALVFLCCCCYQQLSHKLHKLHIYTLNFG